MSNINMSLDDIIAKTKVHKKTLGGKKSFKSQSISKRSSKSTVRTIGGGMKKRGGDGEAFTKIVPSGKWARDKFEDSMHTTSHVQSDVDTNKKVRVNISNLAPTVTTADLQELFTPYSFISASVHYGQNREHLGTGEITMKKSDALKALADLKGIAIDGSRIVMVIVGAGGNGSSIFDRVQMSNRVTGGSIQKRSRPNHTRTVISKRHHLNRTEQRVSSKAGKNGRTMKKQSMNEEDLDAELESYMKKPAMEQ